MISVRNISKSYRIAGTRVDALRDVSMEVRKGELFGIFGPSGAGKTTLLRCLSMLEIPDTGQIIIDGCDVLKLPDQRRREVARQIGCVFQGYNLLSSRTALENVMLPLEIRGIPRSQARDAAKRALAAVNVGHREDFYPSRLSGGEKQRVAIARAMVTSPQILILDEPTSALDKDNALSVLELVREINRTSGVTVVIVSHQVDLVGPACTGRVFLRAGTVQDCRCAEVV